MQRSGHPFAPASTCTASAFGLYPHGCIVCAKEPQSKSRSTIEHHLRAGKSCSVALRPAWCEEWLWTWLLGEGGVSLIALAALAVEGRKRMLELERTYVDSECSCCVSFAFAR